MQILFFSGDADKVISLVPIDRNMAVVSSLEVIARIAIDCDGAIVTPEVQDAITKTMEGGGKKHLSYAGENIRYLDCQ